MQSIAGLKYKAFTAEGHRERRGPNEPSTEIQRNTKNEGSRDMRENKKHTSHLLLAGIGGTVLLALVPIYGLAQSGVRKTKPSQEQLQFSMEEDVQNPAALPKGARNILSKDEDVLGMLEQEKLSPDKLPAAWFSTAKVHLARKEETDFVVIAQYPLAGANVTTFWVLRPTAHGLELILRTGGHNLVIHNQRSNEYRNIEASAGNAAYLQRSFYRFDGKSYKRFKTEGHPY